MLHLLGVSFVGLPNWRGHHPETHKPQLCLSNDDKKNTKPRAFFVFLVIVFGHFEVIFWLLEGKPVIINGYLLCEYCFSLQEEATPVIKLGKNRKLK